MNKKFGLDKNVRIIERTNKDNGKRVLRIFIFLILQEDPKEPF